MNFDYFPFNRVVNGSWDRECGRGLRLYQSDIKLNRWYIVFPNMMERDVNRFVNRAIELGRNMGFEINKPRLYVDLSKYYDYKIIK